MDTEGDMEQNGDKNDAGTALHYPGNYYVDSRLSHEGYVAFVSDAERWA